MRPYPLRPIDLLLAGFRLQLLDAGLSPALLTLGSLYEAQYYAV